MTKTTKIAKEKINKENETSVINLLNSWKGITDVQAASFTDDINSKIDVSYQYNDIQTYAQIKPITWDQTTKVNKIKYLTTIKNFIEKNEKLLTTDTNKLKNPTNFYFIFYKLTGKSKKVSINKIITLVNLINEVNSTETVEFYKANVNWPNSNIDNLKLELAKGIVEVRSSNWYDYIPAKFLAITGLKSTELRKIINENEEIKEYWLLLGRKIRFYQVRGIIIEKYEKSNYYQDSELEFDLQNAFVDDTEVEDSMEDINIDDSLVESTQTDGIEQFEIESGDNEE